MFLVWRKQEKRWSETKGNTGKHRIVLVLAVVAAPPDMQAPNDCPAPGDVVSADRTAPSVPPSTLDFLLPLRNNFRDIIVPRLPQEAKDAILMQKDPKDMTDIERKRTRFAILGAVYGKQSVLGR